MSHDDDNCPHLVRANLLEAENARLKESLRQQIEQNALAQVGFKMYQDNVDSGGLHKDRKDAIARLEAENARLKAEVARLQSIHSIDSIGIEQLKAEVERLTYVGDAMAMMVGHIEVKGDAHRMMLEFSNEWNAAKETAYEYGYGLRAVQEAASRMGLSFPYAGVGRPPKHPTLANR